MNRPLSSTFQRPAATALTAGHGPRAPHLVHQGVYGLPEPELAEYLVDGMRASATFSHEHPALAEFELDGHARDETELFPDRRGDRDLPLRGDGTFHE